MKLLSQLSIIYLITNLSLLPSSSLSASNLPVTAPGGAVGWGSVNNRDKSPSRRNTPSVSTSDDNNDDDDDPDNSINNNNTYDDVDDDEEYSTLPITNLSNIDDNSKSDDEVDPSLNYNFRSSSSSPSSAETSKYASMDSDYPSDDENAYGDEIENENEIKDDDVGFTNDPTELLSDDDDDMNMLDGDGTDKGVFDSYRKVNQRNADETRYASTPPPKTPATPSASTPSTQSSQSTTQPKTSIQFVVTQKMRRVLIDELNYTPTEASNIKPDVAAVVIQRKLVRPESGMPVVWYRDSSKGLRLTSDFRIVNKVVRVVKGKRFKAVLNGVVSGVKVIAPIVITGVVSKRIVSSDFGRFVIRSKYGYGGRKSLRKIISDNVQKAVVKQGGISVNGGSGGNGSVESKQSSPYASSSKFSSLPSSYSLSSSSSSSSSTYHEDDTWLDKGISTFINTVGTVIGGNKY